MCICVAAKGVFRPRLENFLRLVPFGWRVPSLLVRACSPCRGVSSVQYGLFNSCRCECRYYSHGDWPADDVGAARFEEQRAHWYMNPLSRASASRQLASTNQCMCACAVGWVPSEIGQLSSLTYIVAGNNSLTGSNEDEEDE